MKYLADNWFFIVLVIGFFFLMSGHGGCGMHGSHGGHAQGRAADPGDHQHEAQRRRS